MKELSVFKTILNTILDFIYPRHCALCGKVLWHYGDSAVCVKCSQTSRVCKTVRDDRYYFDEAIGVIKYHGNAKEAMLRYKFKSVKYYAKAYARIMDESTGDRPYLRDAVMCCVPVSKRRKRDYSQTKVLAEELSHLWGSHFVPDLLYRSKPVAQLSKMKLPERRFYIQDTIDLNPACDVYGKDILVIDDIYTSGTTANECARILKMYGAERVFVLCPCYD